MTMKFIEKLKSAKTREEAVAMIQALSPEKLNRVTGGIENADSERETIYWLLEQGMVDVAWIYLQNNFGIDDSTKERAIRTYGMEGGVRYIVDRVLNLS